jgi:two-component system response regulator MtrA
VKAEKAEERKSSPIIDVGHLSIDNHARRLLIDGKDIAVTRIEFDILYQLANEQGACIPRATMIRNVWGFEGAASQHSLDVHVHNLRRKLDEADVDDVAIEAVRSVGFRLVAK